EAITAVVLHTIAKYNPTRPEETNPSLVTGEDLAATDDADRAHARMAALGSLRAQVSDVVSARIAALLQLAQSSQQDPDSAIATDAAAIAEATRKALDEGT